MAECSLRSDALAARVETIRREILPHVLEREALADGIAWEFARRPDLRERLERFVEFERGCCGGLDFALVERPEADRLRLTIRGEGASAFDALGR